MTQLQIAPPLEIKPDFLRVGHFASGGGTTFQSAAQKMQGETLWNIHSALLIATKPWIGAIEKAWKLQTTIPVEIILHLKDPQVIIEALTRHKIDVVMLNGALPVMPKEVIEYCETKGIPMFNQHPGDLRADHNDFWGNEKGKWMYGSRVTAARILYLLATQTTWKNVFTSSSIHRLTSEVDGGQLVGQERLLFGSKMEDFRDEVFPEMKTMTNRQIRTRIEKILTGKSELAQRKKTKLMEFISTIQWELLVLEHQNVANTLQRVAQSPKTPLETHPDYHVPLVVGEENLDHLDWSKTIATQMYPKG
jgi:folate-dependent phosphoribosylglycinamide formyltransferase PurN